MWPCDCTAGRTRRQTARRRLRGCGCLGSNLPAWRPSISKAHQIIGINVSRPRHHHMLHRGLLDEKCSAPVMTPLAQARRRTSLKSDSSAVKPVSFSRVPENSHVASRGRWCTEYLDSDWLEASSLPPPPLPTTTSSIYQRVAPHSHPTTNTAGPSAPSAHLQSLQRTSMRIQLPASALRCKGLAVAGLPSHTAPDAGSSVEWRQPVGNRNGILSAPIRAAGPTLTPPQSPFNLPA